MQENGTVIPITEDNEVGGEKVSPIDQAIVEEKYSGHNSTIAQIRERRVKADSIFRTLQIVQKDAAESSRDISGLQRYLSLAITSMESCRHFFERILQEKGAAFPYANQAKLKPEEVGEELDDVLEKTTLRDRLHVLRSKVDDLVTEQEIYIGQINPFGPVDFMAQNTVLERLVSTLFWLAEIFPLLPMEKVEA